MDVQAGNASALEVSAGCAERGNLSAEFGDYNLSCSSNSSSILPKPALRGRGKTSFPPPFCSPPSNSCSPELEVLN